MSNFEFTEKNIESMFGKEAAEDEKFDLLQSYYLKSKTHSQIVSDSKLRILVGHKGIGKSAIFTVARKEEEKNNKISILIKPDDIYQLAKNQEFDEMIRSWKCGLIDIIQEKIIEQFFPEQKTFPKVATHIVSWVEKLIESHTGVKPNISSHFSNDKQIYIYIDDLDRGWKSGKEDIARISALLNAVRDLANNDEGLRFRISLRTDVFYLVRTSDESTDKIGNDVIWHKWENHDILLMLVKRIKAFENNDDLEDDTLKKLPQDELAKHLNKYFEPKFLGSGKWYETDIHKILMSLVRKRPRDMIKLCTLAARDAYENDQTIISTQNWKNIFDQYSQDRLQDTVNEYRSELPNIEKLLLAMKPNKSSRRRGDEKAFLFSSSELRKKLKDIAQNRDFVFSNGKIATADDLMFFLYKINFITARKTDESGKIHRHYFEEKRYIIPNGNIDFGFEYEIHPAYRWALEPQDIYELLSDIN